MWEGADPHLTALHCHSLPALLGLGVAGQSDLEAGAAAAVVFLAGERTRLEPLDGDRGRLLLKISLITQKFNTFHRVGN